MRGCRGTTATAARTTADASTPTTSARSRSSRDNSARFSSAERPAMSRACDRLSSHPVPFSRRTSRSSASTSSSDTSGTCVSRSIQRDPASVGRLVTSLRAVPTSSRLARSSSVSTGLRSTASNRASRRERRRLVRRGTRRQARRCPRSRSICFRSSAAIRESTPRWLGAIEYPVATAAGRACRPSGPAGRTEKPLAFGPPRCGQLV